MKPIIFFSLMALLTASQQASGGSIVRALTSPWQTIKQWRQNPTKHLTQITREVGITDTLRKINRAIAQTDVPAFNHSTQHLRRLIKQDPDLLWHKSDKWNVTGNAAVYLIDAVAPLNFAISTWAQARRHLNDQFYHIKRTIGATYNYCLALSNKSILSSLPKESYVKQLIEEREHHLSSDQNSGRFQEADMKLLLALEHLGDTHRCNTLVQAAPEQMPEDLTKLIGSFCFGAAPKDLGTLKKESTHIEKRHASNKKNEFDLYLRQLAQRADKIGPLDNRQIRAFIRSGMANDNLFSQAERQVIHNTNRIVFRKQLKRAVYASLALLLPSYAARLNCNELADFISKFPWRCFTLSRLKSWFCIGSFNLFVLIATFCSIVSAYTTEIEIERAKQLPPKFRANWKAIVKTINDTRLPFEENVDNIPNIIPVSVSEQNDLDLE